MLLVSAVVGLINVAYIKMDVSDNDDTNKFATMPAHIQICNFGSSHGLYGFNYEDFDDRYECFNFGLASQYLSYDYRLLKYYQRHIRKGTIVFLPVSYFSLFGKSEEEGKEFLAKNKRYYKVLSKEFIKEYDVFLDFGVNVCPSLLANPIDVIKTLIGKSSNSREKTWKQNATEVNLKKDAEKACKRHLSTDKLDDTGHRILNQEELTALCDMIKLCREKGAIPILITTPLLDAYLKEVEKDQTFFAEFYSLMNEIAEETGTEYYDYAFDARFVKRYDWFMNSDHLNKEGARQFVDILIKEIVYSKGYY